MSQRPDPSEMRSYLGPLFEPEPGRPVLTGPLHSEGDKRTSAIAAAHLKADAKTLGELQRAALDLIREFPGRTCKTLANFAHLRAADASRGVEWWRQRIGRRLSELERAGLIHAGETETDTETGRPAVTWWPGEGA